jgi:hypothetical protein
MVTACPWFDAITPVTSTSTGPGSVGLSQPLTVIKTPPKRASAPSIPNSRRFNSHLPGTLGKFATYVPGKLVRKSGKTPEGRRGCPTARGTEPSLVEKLPGPAPGPARRTVTIPLRSAEDVLAENERRRPMKLGMVGLGKMGAAMAERLVEDDDVKRAE